MLTIPISFKLQQNAFVNVKLINQQLKSNVGKFYSLLFNALIMKRLSSLININSLLGEVTYRFNNHPNVSFVFPKTEVKIYSDYSVLKYIFYELIAQQLRNSALQVCVDAMKIDSKVSFTISAIKTFQIDNPPSKFLSVIQNASYLSIKNDPLIAVKKMIEALGGTLAISNLKNQIVDYSFALPIEFEENISNNTKNFSIDSEEDFSQAA